MEFRLGEESDLEQLARMRWDHWAEDGSDSAQQNEEEFVAGFVTAVAPRLNSDWFAWCAVEGDQILSHTCIQIVHKIPKPSAPEDSFGYVSNVYTRPAHRNRGIGEQVLKQVKAWALDKNLEFLVLWPSEQSAPFWSRAGFVEDEPLVHNVRPYVN